MALTFDSTYKRGGVASPLSQTVGATPTSTGDVVYCTVTNSTDAAVDILPGYLGLDQITGGYGRSHKSITQVVVVTTTDASKITIPAVTGRYSFIAFGTSAASKTLT